MSFTVNEELILIKDVAPICAKIPEVHYNTM